MILEMLISISALAAAYRLIVAMRRRANQLRLDAALRAAIAPQPLAAKYCCPMSDQEIAEMNAARWD
jgi:hypothetical protein